MIRDVFVDRLHTDLIGPGDPLEVIADRPGDRYLTGVLFPPRTTLGADQDEDSDTAGDREEGGGGAEAVAGANVMRPSTAGLSFAIRPAPGSLGAISLRISGGRYEPEGKEGLEDDAAPAASAWKRTPQSTELTELVLSPAGAEDHDLSPYGLPGLRLHVRTSPWNEDLLVTAVVTNVTELSGRPGRRELESATFFQFAMEARPACGSRLLARPVGGAGRDEDGRSAALIYRNVAEYAAGHVCSASWSVDADGEGTLFTRWIPAAVVPGTSASGDLEFHDLAREGRAPLSASWLASCDDAELAAGLDLVIGAYAAWIERQASWAGDAAVVPEPLQPQAAVNLGRCRDALARMRRGAELLASDADVRLAFRCANRAMLEQRRWSGAGDLEWYPFQVAFALLTLESLADPESGDREVMDLLWFPTGGGKTEAYLLLTAFVIFLRRLRAERPSAGGGVTVFMRYTLRLLTIQQFQRAAALVCACELLRLGRLDGPGGSLPEPVRRGPAVSIGLWVGRDSTPNTVERAGEALAVGGDSTPVQLTECPCCGSGLTWRLSAGRDRVEVACTKPACALGGGFGPLPVWTVDEDIYREAPSLIIGTADKYAQIVRSAATGALFGLGAGHPPPALVIQDELHLISGPLGTMAGIYEVAVDALCAAGGARPKIIGSTATIRRAREQIRAVFDREAFQFPPPALDHDNSGFAVADPDAPGRLYLGVSTAGRSAKFTLQAVSASLLQSAGGAGLSLEDANPYWTLMVYFNSLRELGGSLVLMQDDVVKSVEDYARRRPGEAGRPAPDVTELNSRVASSDIPSILRRLTRPAGHQDAADVVLASNMISVGMDVPRLGLMVVNGQPKGIAEYIQATSRVGRGRTAGLVVTLYNANKARDRSHFETFATWHQSLYREVEATSVTPFAPRARDRALHAPFVAMARHLVDGLGAEPVDVAGHDEQLEGFIDAIVARAERSDLREAAGVRRYLERRLDQWMARGPIRYWDDAAPDRSLLASAELAAARRATNRGAVAAWPTPNSLRNVEAASEYVLVRDIEEELQ